MFTTKGCSLSANQEISFVPVVRPSAYTSDSCLKCHYAYGAANEPRPQDEWVKCSNCHNWFHETCTEEVGVFEESDNFLCAWCIP